MARNLFYGSLMILATAAIVAAGSYRVRADEARAYMICKAVRVDRVMVAAR